MLQRVDLPVQVLLRGRDARIPKIHTKNVPEVLHLRRLRHAVTAPTCGTPAERGAPDTPMSCGAVPVPRNWNDDRNEPVFGCHGATSTWPGRAVMSIGVGT